MQPLLSTDAVRAISEGEAVAMSNAERPVISAGESESDSRQEDSCQCTYLVVVVRGWGPRGKIGQSLLDELCAMLPDNSKVLQPELGTGFFSTQNPSHLEQDVLEFLIKAIDTEKPARIILFGFNSGCLLLRGALLRALDKQFDWLGRIERVIYAGGILRGWSITTATPFPVRLMVPVIRLLVLLNKLAWKIKVTWFKTFDVHWHIFFLSAVERGTPYVVDQQIRFLDQREKLSHIRFIHLLGTRDRYVSPADTVEILPEHSSTYVELSGVSHFDIVSPEQIERSSSVSIDRWRNTISQSLLGDDGVLKVIGIRRDHIDDYVYHLDLPVDKRIHEEVKDVVMVLHGVRDNGFWTKRIGAKIKGDRELSEIRTPTPSYGFFSVLNFLSIFARKSKVRWFLETYVTLKIHYPNAEISFVGHSNGTYLAVQAMKLCESVKFKRMYFAGCVVRTDFNWCEYDHQVTDRVVNVVNANDYIISTSPGFIEALGWSFLNVGGAGQQGFQKHCLTPKVENFGPFFHGHSGGIAEDYWPAISTFINGGDFVPPHRAETSREALWVLPLRVVCLVALTVLLMSFCALAVLILTKMPVPVMLFTAVWIVMIWAARNV